LHHGKDHAAVITRLAKCSDAAVSYFTTEVYGGIEMSTLQIREGIERRTLLVRNTDLQAICDRQFRSIYDNATPVDARLSPSCFLFGCLFFSMHFSPAIQLFAVRPLLPASHC